MKPFRTFVIGLSSAALLTAGLISTTQTAQASDWDHRGGGGGAIAAGIVGGLALGALAAGAYSSPRYYGGPAYYDAPPYGPECYWTVRNVYDEYGYYLGRRRVHVCR
jgi:hypothetical protein